MNLNERLNRSGADRRETDLTPIVERRQLPERRTTARWLEWTRANESRGKSLDGRAA